MTTLLTQDTAQEIDALCQIWVDTLEPLVGLPGDARRADLPVALRNVLAAVDACFDAVGTLPEDGSSVAAVARAGQDLQRVAIAMLAEAGRSRAH